MKVIILVSLCWCGIIIAGTSLNHNQQQLILIDTDGHDQENYKTLTNLFSSLNVNLDYANIYTMLEGKQLTNYDGIALVLGIPFIKSIKNQLALNILQKLQGFCMQGNKKIILLFPSPSYSEALHAIIRAIFNSLWNQQLANDERIQLDNFLHEALQSDAKRGMIYGTTLLVPHNSSKTLPPEAVPRVFTIHDANTNNDFLLGQFSDFSYADIGENFFKNPFDITLRDSLLLQSLKILQQFFSQEALPLPQQLTTQASIKKTSRANLDSRYEWIQKEGISCAWLSPDDFFGADIDTKKLTPIQQKSIKENSLQNGMTQLVNSEYNLLWFEFIPEWYLSSHGHRKEQRDCFIERTKKIASQLKNAYKDKPMPKIFMGTNLTSNFRIIKPKNAVMDMWGTTYPNIPCPLDIEHFWQPELFEPLQEFVTLFSKEFPIDGVFLDLEMYHAQDQFAHYGDVHDFSDYAWNVCAPKIRAPNITSADERIAYLSTHKKFADYFSCLKKEATNIGKLIKQKIRHVLPQAIIGVYAMTLPESWFYRGLCRGLSSPTEPVLFASFNTDFYGHAKKLQEQNIYLLHGAVYMLSKLQKVQDAAMITQLRSYHDFVWFNKSSRMAYDLTPEQIKQQYWALEASPLPVDEVILTIKKTRNIPR